MITIIPKHHILITRLENEDGDLGAELFSFTKQKKTTQNLVFDSSITELITKSFLLCSGEPLGKLLKTHFCVSLFEKWSYS